MTNTARRPYGPDYGPVIASGELDGSRWEYRGRIEGVRLTEYFSAPGGAKGRSTALTGRPLECLGWGGEFRPGRPNGWLMHIRGIVRKGSSVDVHLLDGTVVPAQVLDVGDPETDFFVAVMPPRSSMWKTVVANGPDGNELYRCERREFSW